MPAWAAEVMVFSHRPMRSVESFTQQLQQLSKHDIAQTTQVDALAGAKLVVAVGAPSVAALAGKVSQPVLAVYITRQHYLQYQAQLRSALFIEPPLARQLALARALLGPEQQLGVLLEAREQWSEFSAQPLRADGTVDSLLGPLRVVAVSDYDSLNHALVALLKDSHALVGVYDPELYSAANIKNILITAYRQNVPLFGPSNAYIKAGALATTHSDMAQMAQRTAEMLDLAIAGNWPAAGYNPYFHVRYNEQVARSLNMVLPDAQALAAELADPSP
ncbi:hypothetical protein [Bacterioplanes sanyensis]|uniref:hypothetical protein n=1 Tax=Bacterioplanes sanyensis TaxID=1249553 RepID=UPI0016756BFA|nr:hypothetical protein [Bacterioplanes sanyensis]